MNGREALILIIFILTYVFIAIQRIPGIRIDRPSGVTIGSTLLLLTGLMTIRDAYAFIDWDVITFLLGMMVMIAYLEFAGFFEYVAAWLVQIAPNSAMLLLLTIISSAILSAFFVNDTICLLFTPVILKATRMRQLNPVPYLIAIATASNLGSALTVTGNPQNMYIGIKSGIPFLQFSLIMVVPVLFGLIFNYMIIRFFYRQQINRQPLEKLEWKTPRLKKALTLKTLGALVTTLILFISGVSYPLAALIGASVILIIGYVPPRYVLKNVDWTILLFFAGLFIVMGAFNKAGYMEKFIIFTAQALNHPGLTGFLSLAFIIALLSNIVSNVPAVILMEPIVLQLGNSIKSWMLLALASTFAGNLTLIGSVANLIVAEKAQSRHVHLGFWDYLRVGFLLTLLTLILGTLWLWWIL